MVKVHLRCHVPPPPLGGDTAEISMPLTFFDIIWLHFHPIQRLLFYKFPCSTSHFHNTIVPNLKNSLSQTLKDYLPIAGRLYVPLNSGMPELRYVPGDSISFTVAETSDDSDSNSDSDFEYLIGNQPRDADKFYPFVPDLAEPETDKSGSFKTIPVLSVQVTLFPETGICIGISNHHVAGDASSIVGFIKAWSTLARLDDEILATNVAASLPFYDRSGIKDPSNRANIFWNQMKVVQFGPPPQNLPTNKVRSTFVMSKVDVQNLRNLVLSKKPGLSLTHLSPFTITTAYVWSCLAKTAEKIGEEVDSNEPEYYTISIDVRRLLDPPLPASYFGNCLDFGVTESTYGKLKSGEDGFLTAVEVASRLISEKVNNKEELLKDADEWPVKLPPLFKKRIFGVAGSPKFDLYDADFGWGNPVKFESVSIDGGTSMSLCKSREFEGGFEIGLSRPKEVMEAFEAVFYGGLKV